MVSVSDLLSLSQATVHAKILSRVPWSQPRNCGSVWATEMILGLDPVTFWSKLPGSKDPFSQSCPLVSAIGRLVGLTKYSYFANCFWAFCLLWHWPCQFSQSTTVSRTKSRRCIMHEYALELRVLITYPAIETAFLHKPPSDSSHYATCSVSSVQRPTNYRQAHPICKQNGAGILPNLQTIKTGWFWTRANVGI